MPMYESVPNAVTEAVGNYLINACSTEAGRQMHLCGTGAITELEEKLKKHYSMRYALCVSNATTGLLAIALALELKQTEFVTSPLTYGGSLSGWLLLGCKPIFADIDPVSLTLNTDSVRKAITPKVRAILAIDIFGNPTDTSGLRKLADDMGVWYVADAAQSLGAFRDDKPASGLADVLVVSFTAGKSVFAGEGGAVLTNSSDLYEKLVWHTQHPFRQRRDISLQLSNEFGINARIHPVAALWANAAFEPSLNHLKQHQDECFTIIDALNSTDLTERIDFREKRIEPAFFRLTSAWKDKPQPSTLLKKLSGYGFSVSLTALPVRLIYQHPAFILQYRRYCKTLQRCPQAERQASTRFCLVKE
jgi:perosamine synthetase